MTDARSLLIVDDDAAFRERLVRAMRDRGYEATGVADHPAAIDAAREESPELALVDLRFPGNRVWRSCAISRRWIHPPWSSC